MIAIRFSLAAVLTCLLGQLCLLQSSGAEEPSSQRPNVVIILADDMGYGDPGCYNDNSKCPTPNIDRLAAGGMKFTDAHAAGAWCTPSRYGLLTGRYAFRTELAWQKQPVIQEGTATLASTLKQAGYNTAMVGKWHLGFVDGKKIDYSNAIQGGPCDRGFDSFFGLPASLDIPDFYWIQDRKVTAAPTVPIAKSNSEGWSEIQGKFWRAGKRGEDFVMEDVLDRIGKTAVAKIDELSNQNEPFLLYVPLTSPHTPWLPSSKYQQANEAGLYSQFVNHTDAIVGQIIDQLETTNELENTLLVFTSDNGPVWYDYDKQRFGHDSMGGWRGMKGDVWEAGHRVPFIVHWPGNAPAGSTCDQLLSFVDLHATLASIAGLATPSTAIDSLDFAKVFRGDNKANIRRELVCFQEPLALRQDSLKLIMHPGSIGFLSHRYQNRSAFLNKKAAKKDEETLPPGQLYDLSSDPGETKNLWNTKPEIVEKMKQRLLGIKENSSAVRKQ